MGAGYQLPGRVWKPQLSHRLPHSALIVSEQFSRAAHAEHVAVV